MPSHAGHERMQTVSEYFTRGAEAHSQKVTVDRTVTFDTLTNVHYSGTRHEEDQPTHLVVHDTDICRTRCVTEYQNPCTRFCPANVYEILDADAGEGKRLRYLVAHHGIIRRLERQEQILIAAQVAGHVCQGILAPSGQNKPGPFFTEGPRHGRTNSG